MSGCVVVHEDEGIGATRSKAGDENMARGLFRNAASLRY
jgi:hypothetical protein